MIIICCSGEEGVNKIGEALCMPSKRTSRWVAEERRFSRPLDKEYSRPPNLPTQWVYQHDTGSLAFLAYPERVSYPLGLKIKG